MTTEIGVPGEEAAVEVLIDTIVIGMGGIGVIAAAAGAVALVLITIGPEEEVIMMMSFKSEAEADQWIMPPLIGAAGVALVLAEVLPHRSLCLLGVKVLKGEAMMDGPQLLIVFHPGAILLILEANPRESQMLI
ncbi:hypothetical protein CIPAW_05G035900 [Carya illinoinensis]|uniref:Uncharacterized protein n=1 Tax=Carya illinoinensis TaxID=32201 RepID=A0A8T1QE71_CARIL|nr:hypothetical protein CIPAW_05G035900 [Carya illinoinensis]